jgi:hypothetical protein
MVPPFEIKWSRRMRAAPVITPKFSPRSCRRAILAE